MTLISAILTVISIILIFLSQDVNLRVRHRESYLIDVDTPFLGFSLDTREKQKKDAPKRPRGRKKKNKPPFHAYYRAISYLVSHSTVSIGKLFPPRSTDDSAISLLSPYVILNSLLSLVINKSEKTSLATDHSLADANAPNIDAAFRFSLLTLIISLLLFQYYNKKKRKVYTNVR